MITLKTLRWGNAFSYGDDNEISLDSGKITQLVGNNGMGKSSIPLVLEEALFNKNSKGVKKADIPNRLLQDGYWIELEFSKGGTEYKVVIKRKSTIKVQLFADGVDISSHKSTDTFSEIERILGLPFKTATQLIYQGTTSSLQFLTAPDTARKRFLIELLDLTEYTDVFDLIKEDMRQVQQKVDRLQGQLESVKSWLARTESMDLSPQTLLPEEGEEALEELYQQESEVSTLQAQVKEASTTNKRINQNNSIKAQLETFDMSVISSADGLEKPDLTGVTRDLGEARGEIKQYTTLAAKLSKVGTECPSCLQPVDSALKDKMLQEALSSKKVLEARISELEAERQEGLRVAAKVDAAEQKKQDLRELHTLYDEHLESELVNVQETQNKITKLQSAIQATKALMAKVRDENMRRVAHNAKVDMLTAEHSDREEELSRVCQELAELSNKLAVFEVLKKAFSTNGLVAYKIENLVKELEEAANAYLGDLSSGRFSLAFVVEKDKLNVSLTDEGREISISALSSGELARVNTATLLAIRKLMSSLSKASINVLFLDEVTNVLDMAGRESLVDVLMQEPGLNTFLVSHGWSHPLLDKIEIAKVDGISRLVHDG